MEKNKRMYHLDVARVIAIALVTLYHIWTRMGEPQQRIGFIDTYGLVRWGNVGVILMVILSGYLVIGGYRRLNGMPVWKKLRNFYWNKFLRIAPAYYVAILIKCMLNGKAEKWNVITHLLFIHNSFEAYSDGITGAFWYLSLQMGLYLFTPLFFFLWRKVCTLFSLSGGRRIWTELGMAAALFGIDGILFQQGLYEYHSIYFLAPFFLLGMALYNLQEVCDPKSWGFQILGILMFWAGIAMMFCWQKDDYRDIYRGVMAILLGGGMILFSRCPVPQMFRETFALLSQASYSIYLYNFVMNYTKNIKRLGEYEGTCLWMLFYMAIVFGFGMLMYPLVEQPMHKLTAKIRAR